MASIIGRISRLPFLFLIVITTPLAAETFRPVAVTQQLEHDGVVFQLAEYDPENERIPPLVVLLGGSEGGLWYGSMGWELTGAGLSTMSLSYFGHEAQPSHLAERPLEPIAALIAEARQSRGAEHRCIAIIGVSKGGELALLLAAYEAELLAPSAPIAEAVVAAVPSHVVWQAPHATLRIRSSWSIGGEPMSFVPYPWLSRHLPDVFFNRMEVGRYLEDALRNTEAVERALIPVERIERPTLLLAGEHDEMWPSAHMARAVVERAERLNPQTPVSLDVRPLGHFVLSDPDARSAAIAFIRTILREAVDAGHCEADLL